MNNFFHKIVYRVLQCFFVLGFLTVFAVGAAVSYPKFNQVRGLETEREKLNKRMQEKVREIAEIRECQRRFNTDREFVETLARRDRRIFPGEIVFIFED